MRASGASPMPKQGGNAGTKKPTGEGGLDLR